MGLFAWRKHKSLARFVNKGDQQKHQV